MGKKQKNPPTSRRADHPTMRRAFFLKLFLPIGRQVGIVLSSYYISKLTILCIFTIRLST
ncbi:MAG: hypothetical protein WCG25_05165 [bacterium]